MVSLPLVGGCQCGALRYAVSAPPLMIYNCHCTNCQTIGGGAFGTPATVLEASFAFTDGRAAQIRVELGCRQSPLWTLLRRLREPHRARADPRGRDLEPARRTLDDTSWIEPVGDIWVRSKQPWVVLSKDRIQTEQQPGDYAPFIERFRAQGRFPS